VLFAARGTIGQLVTLITDGLSTDRKPTHRRSEPMSISQEDTETIIAAAQARARELDLRVTVAVVDEGGLLNGLSRMDGARSSGRSGSAAPAPTRTGTARRPGSRR